LLDMEVWPPFSFSFWNSPKCLDEEL
jgi:hypothetical protein